MNADDIDFFRCLKDECCTTRKSNMAAPINTLVQHIQIYKVDHQCFDFLYHASSTLDSISSLSHLRSFRFRFFSLHRFHLLSLCFLFLCMSRANMACKYSAFSIKFLSTLTSASPFTRMFRPCGLFGDIGIILG